ncbi:nucleotide-binding domain-containing protein [Schleiferilactobacillus perolens]|jgi:hypothetical protein|uniref:nucleotide-binding domain-containing protein n=1 Tax=Schleiferilactobacillus perolens TaxID=100468 RepID=UPI0023532B51|nr:nucleotidyltransferase [Schleiferilactobacillus perolens]MCI2170034.1 nucleotidyltransferase [Schleiferilactobacillus perolens]
MTSINSKFQKFIKSISESKDQADDFLKTLNAIDSKVDSHYYQDETGYGNKHVIKVGSVGRKTNISATSDYDVLCVLPDSVKERFSTHSHGQSDLLQEVKNVLLERFPKTKIRGDGQVVVVEMNKGKIELVPAFSRTDNRYDYPDTHNGGSWQQTNPHAEISQAKLDDAETNGKFTDIAKIIRSWKDNQGIVLKGIIIDSILDKCYTSDFLLKAKTDYVEHLISFFHSAGNQISSVVSALGSADLIDNTGTEFIESAKDAESLLINADSPDALEQAMIQLVGSRFSDGKRAVNEQFIDELFPMHIRYRMSLDAKISQDGFRDFPLVRILREQKWLKADKKLHFFIKHTNIPRPLLTRVKFYWKVRNVGDEAISRNEERGQIVRDSSSHDEGTKFNGPHYVECFAILDQVVIARARINVPINLQYGVDQD